MIVRCREHLGCVIRLTEDGAKHDPAYHLACDACWTRDELSDVIEARIKELRNGAKP